MIVYYTDYYIGSTYRLSPCTVAQCLEHLTRQHKVTGCTLHIFTHVDVAQWLESYMLFVHKCNLHVPS